MSKLKEYIQKELELQNKKRLTGEDEVDIFEGGPAGRVLKDIDPLTGGIQLEEDDLFGDQTVRNITGFTSALLQDVVPKEKELDLQQQRAQQQAIYDQLLQVTGLEADSFEGQRLLALLKGNKEFADKMGFNRDIGTTDSPRFGLYDFGNFILGPARDGLTTMTETGASIKDLPFEQKLGIFFLPIDALDVIGVGALARGGLRSILKAGVKKYGKNSKLTLKNIVDDKELMDDVIKNNPEVEDFLQEFGFDSVSAARTPKSLIDKMKKDPSKEAIGPVGTKPKTRKDIEAEEIRGTAESLEGTFEGKQAQDPAPPKGTYPLTKLKTSIKNDPKFENEETLSDFIAMYENQYGQSTAGPNKEIYMEKQLGKENFEKLKELAKNQGVKIRNMGPKGRKITEDAMEFLKQNHKTMNAQELLDVLNSDKSRYFHTNKAGDFYEFDSLKNFINYKNDQGFTGTPRMPEEVTRLGTAKYNKAVKQFEKKIKEIQKAGQVELTPEVVAKEFEFAVRRAEGIGNKRLTAKEAVNFSNLYSQRIKKYNATLPEGSPLRVLNRVEIKNLKAGGGKGRTQIANKFNAAVTQNEGYQEALNFLGDGNAETLKRFLNFIRESTTDVKGDVREFGNFLDSMSPRLKELQNEDSIFRKNYDYFKIVDDAREEMGELSKPFLNKLFKTPAFREIDGQKIVFDKELLDPDSKTTRSLQIAHRYEGDQIGETLPKDLSGASEFPQSYTIDVSFINQGVQPKLEAQARNAVAAGDEEAMRKIHLDAERFGTAFEVDGVQFGTQKGIADKLEQYLQYVVRRPDLQEKFGITKQEILNMRQAIEKARSLNAAGYNFQRGGLITEDMNIFDDEEQGTIFPKISIEFGDAARGTVRRFGEDEPVKRAALEEKVFDVPPMENIFTGEVQEANLKLPFYKLFTKPPVNETAPIPTPKEALDNPTKKQLQSLEQEKLNKEQDFFDPTPEDNQKVDLGSSTDVAATPKTNQPLTGVFYSDAEKVLQRPDTPVIFPNKQALIDFFAKNRIKKTELEDYGINNLLKAFDEVTPIPKDAVIRQIRSAPVRGMHVHATGKGSEIINPSGENVNVAYEGYRADGFIPGTTSERILYIPMDKLPGDTAVQPRAIFQGEDIQNHGFGLPGGSDNNYVVGWTRLSERRALLPTKLDAPAGKSKIPGLTRERERAQRQVAGLYAEAINKLNREAVRRGFDQRELERLSQLSLEQIMLQYGDTMNELSPGLLDQIDDLIVKVRDLDTQITKASSVDASNVVKVQFADEIQSDIMQAAAGRKQKLLATLRKLQEEGRESTTLPELDRVGNEALAFFEQNKSVFRPLKKSQTEVDIFADSLSKVDADIDDIINRFVETREISDADITRVKSLLNDQIDQMINDLITVDANTYDGLFPDLPFKKREEWADALIKKDLFELAYRKFVLKDPDVPDYYAVTPDTFVISRYSFQGNTATSAADRAADKAAQIKAFTERGEFIKSKYRGIGMSEFYGGPNAVDEKGKHYTSTIEKILKTQAKSNNSEMIILNVQTKSGGSDIYRITDQNGNMVATLTDARQVQLIRTNNPNYNVEAIRVPDMKNTTPSFAIKITEEMLEPYKTHKARGGLVEMIDIFEVA